VCRAELLFYCIVYVLFTEGTAPFFNKRFPAKVVRKSDRWFKMFRANLCASRNLKDNCNVLLLRAINISYLPAGRSVLGKTVPEVLSTARGRRPRAVLKTEGTVFPNMDRPSPANNVFIISSVEYFVSSFCVEFSLQPFSNLGKIKFIFAMIAVVI